MPQLITLGQAPPQVKGYVTASTKDFKVVSLDAKSSLHLLTLFTTHPLSMKIRYVALLSVAHPVHPPFRSAIEKAEY